METWLAVGLAVVGWVLAVVFYLRDKEKSDEQAKKINELRSVVEAGFGALRASDHEKAIQIFTGYYQEHQPDLPLPEMGSDPGLREYRPESKP